MTEYHWHALVCVTILAAIHLFSAFTRSVENRLLLEFQRKSNIWYSRFLSMAGGIAASYVFVELMPKLGISQKTLHDIVEDLIPLKERHVYLVAFLGFLFFYGINSMPLDSSLKKRNLPFLCNLISYLLFNFLVGYEVVDIHDPFIRPLYLFTFAVGLHYFITDHSLQEKYSENYNIFNQMLLAAALYLGFVAGILFAIPKYIAIYAVAFTAGGMILNVLRYELPKKQKSSTFAFFTIGGILYSMILVYQV